MMGQLTPARLPDGDPASLRCSKNCEVASRRLSQSSHVKPHRPTTVRAGPVILSDARAATAGQARCGKWDGNDLSMVPPWMYQLVQDFFHPLNIITKETEQSIQSHPTPWLWLLISILEDKPESEIWCDDSYHGKGPDDIGHEAGLLASV